MTLASEIITRAFREANYKNTIGTLTAEESSEGLALLQSIVDSLAGLVVGTKLTPWFYPDPQRTGNVAARYPATPGDYAIPSDQTYPPANVRLVMRNQDPVTLYFQYAPDDGALMEYVDAGHEGDVTLEGNGALIGLTGSNENIEITALYPAGRNTPRRWVYRGDYASWVEITTLAQTSTIPFPTALDDYFVTALAIRLSPRFGSEPRQITLMRYKEMQTFIRLQYLQSKEVVVGGTGLAEQSYRFAGGAVDPDTGVF